MRIRVYLPPYFGRGREALDEDGFVHINQGAALKDLFRLLKVPFASAAVHLCRVNYDRASLETTLNDGDIVSFFSPVTGG